MTTPTEYYSTNNSNRVLQY